MPPPARPPPPGSQSAPSSTSRPHHLPSVVKAKLQVRWVTGHWFDSHLLRLERGRAGTDRTGTAPETEVGQRDQRGEERSLAGPKEERR